MKKIIIFGASGYGDRVFYSLPNQSYQIVLFIDNCQDLWASQKHGISVQPPARVVEHEYDYIVLSSANYSEAMRTQLLELGVPAEKIVDFICFHPQIQFDEERLALARRCLDRIKEKQTLGSMAELGVYQGDFAQYLNYACPEKKLYLFDTFTGFAAQDAHPSDTNTGYPANFQDTTIEQVLAKMKSPENIVIRKGYFPETAAGLEEQFCFVSLDADLYLPTLRGLEFFYPRLVKGGFIFIHDVYTYHWTGCKKAVDEYCDQNNISFLPILDRCGSVVITK